MALGIGKISYEGDKITESNGEAFINSGQAFELLRKDTIGIKTPWGDFDEVMNIMMMLASNTMDEWSPTSSEIIELNIKYPDLIQKDLAEQLDKKQSDISKGIKRAGYDSIKKMMRYYTNKIAELC